MPCLEGESPRDARIREIFYLNMTRFLTLLLDRKDRMSMGLAWRYASPSATIAWCNMSGISHGR
ncbi:hypothetical protein KSZ_50000 [Dictyobacter formicarum]|uniref:Uncharacterized protein n=1 Tax=Dictyobacter formicarum TaxID=2778368 RepID=A0ABQ3VMT8_9CHLR|nr:hypothetical protein KSZ_50000 [Dictyobacter formicarum]